jgi:hypothetical protein
MFTASLFTINNLWKQPRCPTTHEWIKKMWYLYKMEFYTAMKNNENLSFAVKWMELENITLSELTRLRNTKIVCSPSFADFRSKTNAKTRTNTGGIGKSREAKIRMCLVSTLQRI